jgi:hypothetical protein
MERLISQKFLYPLVYLFGLAQMTVNNLLLANAFEKPFLVDCLNDARIHHRGDVGF